MADSDSDRRGDGRGDGASERSATTPGNRKALGLIERLGNAMPDPGVLFVALTAAVFVVSAALAERRFSVLDPQTHKPIVVVNLLDGKALVAFLSSMVESFAGFAPLGVVLVTMLGVGVADKAGLVRALIEALLRITPRALLTPAVVLAAIFSHVAADAGMVLVIPLGGALFYAAGRHPLAGIAAAFGGVAGAFTATFLPTPLDPLLQGFTQSAARLVDETVTISPLCNFYFTTASSFLLIAVAWWITDRVIEPRLTGVPYQDAGEPGADAPVNSPTAPRSALWFAILAAAVLLAGLAVAALWPSSPLADKSGSLLSAEAPLMRSVVPLIFVLFLVPGIVYGVLVGRIRNDRDVFALMSTTMSDMGPYIVLAFFAAQFTTAFKQSNLGALLAVTGAQGLLTLQLPVALTLVLSIVGVAALNLLIGSASAKWALISPVVVPMLMQASIAPELVQAAYRVGDSSTNIVTPLLPYFPLILVYCRRYVSHSSTGTVVALMLPYSLAFLLSWTALLLAFVLGNVPLGPG